MVFSVIWTKRKAAFSSVEGSMKRVARGSRVGAVVAALASRQCGPGSIPGPSVICGSSLLLVHYSAPRGFSPGTPDFPSPQKPTFLNFNTILECTGISNELLRTPGARWVNK